MNLLVSCWKLLLRARIFLFLLLRPPFVTLFLLPLPLLFTIKWLDILTKTYKKLSNSCWISFFQAKKMTKLTLKQFKFWLRFNSSFISKFSKLGLLNCTLTTYKWIITTFVNSIKTILRQLRPLGLAKSYLPYYFYMKRCNNSDYSTNVIC